MTTTPTTLLRPALAALCAATIASAQQTLTVGPNGQFADLPPAVAAANPGDTILIESSTAYYSPTTVDKGITLVGSGFPTAVRQLTIDSVPASQRVVVQDLGVAFLPGLTGTALTVSNCAGPVWLDGADVQGISGVRTHFEHCAHVVLRNCFLSAYPMPHVVDNCRLTADRTSFYGDSGSPSEGAVRFVDSDVRLTNCYVRRLPPIFTTAPALRVDRSTLQLINTVLDVQAFVPSPEVVGVCPGPSTLLLHAPNPAPTTSGCVTSSFADIASLSLTDVVRGSSTTIRAYGPANAAVLLFVGKPATPPTMTALGLLTLSAPDSALLAARTLPSTGHAAIQFPVVPPQLPVGLAIELQAVVLSAGGVSLSTSTSTRVR